MTSIYREKATKDVLKHFCRKAALPLGGNKQNLLQRLQAHYER